MKAAWLHAIFLIGDNKAWKTILLSKPLGRVCRPNFNPPQTPSMGHQYLPKISEGSLNNWLHNSFHNHGIYGNAIHIIWPRCPINDHQIPIIFSEYHSIPVRQYSSSLLWRICHVSLTSPRRNVFGDTTATSQKYRWIQYSRGFYPAMFTAKFSCTAATI